MNERVFHFYDGFSREDIDLGRSIPGHCFYSVVLYPSRDMIRSYIKRVPPVVIAMIVVSFSILIMVYLLYDYFVGERNLPEIRSAIRSSGFVTSIFPSSVLERLMAEKDTKDDHILSNTVHNKIRSFLIGGLKLETENDIEDEDFYKSKPIADLFPETTVLVADLDGFAAWSSTREPTQVFILLETIYKSFDIIAKRRRVLKVEAAGDCYVAISGIPDPREDHALVMAHFAMECQRRVILLTKKLEVRLGPDTTDLEMRFGMHSGPVTAGVLRGERPRFQLFGDTMSVAYQMESTGKRGMIQVSHSTAKLLAGVGKQHWLTPRDDSDDKGELQTFWLDTSQVEPHFIEVENNQNVDVIDDDNISGILSAMENPPLRGLVNARVAKMDRLVQWNIDVLLGLLKKIEAMRNHHEESDDQLQWTPNQESTILEEMREVISLPSFNPERPPDLIDPEGIDLGEHVEQQLLEYVSSIAAIYRDNPFHNFEHASHVMMSVVKLLSRIVAPNVETILKSESMENNSMHINTFGITSDPLTQFACVYSALIHDVDHPGIPNTQLMIENPQLSSFYKYKSVAEQNSVDLSWDMLQDESFNDMRRCIYQTKAEQQRFRQLVVNAVMATDLMDEDLRNLRNDRWKKVFSGATYDESPKSLLDRKATIVIEHLIQASDVAHTMQHWHIYRKWNERLFEEMYSAYMVGRIPADPSLSWYKNELVFFDDYIIPLAWKLKDCGVFGVSSEEYLNYAKKNREEWAVRGPEIMKGMIKEAQEKHGSK